MNNTERCFFPVEEDIKKGLKISMPKNPKTGNKIDVEITHEINTLVMVGFDEYDCTILPDRYKGVYDAEGGVDEVVYIGESSVHRHGRVEKGDVLRYHSEPAVYVEGVVFLREPDIEAKIDIYLCKFHSDGISDEPKSYLGSRRCLGIDRQGPYFSKDYDELAPNDKDVHNSITRSSARMVGNIIL
jgi:hypothetical protein